jgi:hypothetical protein
MSNDLDLIAAVNPGRIPMTYLTLEKKIVTDETQRPVAVQIDYRDWLKIEQLLNLKKPSRAVDFFANHAPLTRFLGIEPTEYVDNLRQHSRILWQEDQSV